MPIRRIEGATPAPVIDVNGKQVTLWNHGTTADGINLTVKTLRPICEAINEGYDDLSAAVEAEKLRAIQAETDLSGWCDSLSSKLDTVSSNLDIVSGDLIDEIERSTTKDEELQSQIDTIEAATDVIDVFGTYSQFNTEWKTKYFPTGKKPTITDNDIIKIINDEHTPVGDTDNLTTGHQTYYQWTWTATTHTTTADGDWDFIGFTEPYYNTAEIDGIIRDTKTELSSMVSNNYLSAKGAVLTGKNIAITEDANYPKITIATKDNVIFTSVTSTGFSGTNLSGASKHDTIDNLFGSAYSGVAASAYITAHSADFLNSAHNAYGTLTFGTKAYPATNSSYNFTFIAGQGIGFTTGNNQITISAEGTTYQAGDYISTANKTISVTGSLLTSATGGSAAYNLLTGQSATLYPGPGIQFYSAAENKLGIKVSAAGINGTITSIAGSALSAGANYTDGRYIYIDNNNNSINLSSNIIIDYMSANSALLSAIYDSEHYFNYLTPSSIRFAYGFGGTTISWTGVELVPYQSSPKNIPWTKLLDDFVLTTGNASGSKLSANTAITLVVTSQLPSILEENTYYIV